MVTMLLFQQQKNKHLMFQNDLILKANYLLFLLELFQMKFFSEKRIDMKERKVHSVLVTARVAPEKTN